jgi:hypothetical protein
VDLQCVPRVVNKNQTPSSTDGFAVHRSPPGLTAAIPCLRPCVCPQPDSVLTRYDPVMACPPSPTGPLLPPTPLPASCPPFLQVVVQQWAAAAASRDRPAVQAGLAVSQRGEGGERQGKEERAANRQQAAWEDCLTATPLAQQTFLLAGVGTGCMLAVAAATAAAAACVGGLVPDGCRTPPTYACSPLPSSSAYCCCCCCCLVMFIAGGVAGGWATTC